MKLTTCRSLAILSLLAAAGCAHAQAVAPLEIKTDGLPVWKAKALGAPVKTARQWASALSPRPEGARRGGWNYITQFWNYERGSELNPEWVVLDLQTGKYTIQTDLPSYSRGDIKTQVRAANGRIFFPGSGTYLHYYDPLDEKVKTVGRIFDPKKSGYEHFYRLEIGPDGKIYGTTQSNNGRSAIVVVNPDTLEYKTFTDLGDEKRTEKLTYGYWMALDPPWVYVSIGQNQWALEALNTQTGEKKVLVSVASPGIISFNNRPEGIRATITTPYDGAVPADPDDKKDLSKGAHQRGHTLYMPEAKKKSEYYWLNDGKMIPADPKVAIKDLPFVPLNTKKYDQVEWKQTRPMPIGPMPELDDTSFDSTVNGHYTLRWRADDKSEWKAVSFQIKNTAPVKIQSLTALPDKTILGSTEQYNGWFRYDPQKNSFDYYGKFGPSQARTALKDGKVYFSGYPLGGLWVYDPAKPWSSTRETERSEDASLNPHFLGGFGETTLAHYTYFLIPADNGRLYFGGRRERKAHGAGLGYYDIAAHKFFGLLTENAFLTPRGMLLLPSLKRIVFSGEVGPAPGAAGARPDEAQLIVYDLDFKEIERLSVRPGLQNSGNLYAGAKDTQIVGRIDDDKNPALYLYDLEKKQLLKWLPLAQNTNGFSRGPDGWYWTAIGDALVKINPADLTVTPVARMEMPMGITWLDGEPYGTVDGVLYRIETTK